MFKLAWKEFTRCKVRSTIGVIGYSLAVIIFGVMLTLTKTSEKAVSKVLSNTGTHFIAYQSLCCGLPWVGDEETNKSFLANGISAQPLPIQLADTIKALPEVLDASPFLLYKISDTENNEQFTIGGLFKIDAISVANTSCSVRDIIKGRFLKATDTRKVMLEQSYALSKNIRIADKIKIAGYEFEVVGIVNPGIRPAKADIYMLFSDAEKVISKKAGTKINGVMNIVLVEALNANVHKIAVRKVTKIMGARGLISSYGCHKPASASMAINKKMLTILGTVILLFVLAFAARNQMQTIHEKRHDIGILVSLGWTSKSIGYFIFSESLFQSIIGSFLGGIFVICFILLSHFAITTNTEINFLFAMKSTAVGILIVNLVVILMGFTFRIIGARKDPAEYLHTF